MVDAGRGAGWLLHSHARTCMPAAYRVYVGQLEPCIVPHSCLARESRGAGRRQNVRWDLPERNLRDARETIGRVLEAGPRRRAHWQQCHPDLHIVCEPEGPGSLHCGRLGRP